MLPRYRASGGFSGIPDSIDRRSSHPPRWFRSEIRIERTGVSGHRSSDSHRALKALYRHIPRGWIGQVTKEGEPLACVRTLCMYNIPRTNKQAPLASTLYPLTAEEYVWSARGQLSHVLHSTHSRRSRRKEYGFSRAVARFSFFRITSRTQSLKIYPRSIRDTRQYTPPPPSSRSFSHSHQHYRTHHYSMSTWRTRRWYRQDEIEAPTAASPLGGARRSPRGITTCISTRAICDRSSRGL